MTSLNKELLTADTTADLKEWYAHLDKLGVRYRTGRTSENRGGKRMRTFTVYTDSEGLTLFDTNYVPPGNPAQGTGVDYNRVKWDSWGYECYQMLIGLEQL